MENNHATQIVAKPILSDVDQAIIAVLKESNGLSTKEIGEVINKSQRATRTRLINLIEKGVVVEIGKGKHDPGRKYFFQGDM